MMMKNDENSHDNMDSKEDNDSKHNDTQPQQPEQSQPQQQPQQQQQQLYMHRFQLGVPPANGGPRYYITDRCMYILCAVAGILVLLVSISKPSAIPGFMFSLLLVCVFYTWWYRHRKGVYAAGEVGRDLDGRLGLYLFLTGFCLALVVGMFEMLLTVIYNVITSHKSSSSAADGGDDDEFSSSQRKDAGFFVYMVFMAFVVAAGCEEALKYYLARRIKLLHPSIRARKAIVFFAACGPLGFAVIENVMYVASTQSLQEAVILGAIRIVVPLHVCTGMLIGVGFVRRWCDGDTHLSWYRILAFPLFYHGLYDFLLFLISSYATESNEDASLGLVIGVMAMAMIVIIGHTVWAIRKYVLRGADDFRRLPNTDDVEMQ